MAEAAPSSFTVLATGQIESAEVSGAGRREEAGVTGPAQNLPRPQPQGATTGRGTRVCGVAEPLCTHPHPSPRRRPPPSLFSCQIPDCDNAYVKFQLVAGEDWQLLDGLEEGITQAARVSGGACRARMGTWEGAGKGGGGGSATFWLLGCC